MKECNLGLKGIEIHVYDYIAAFFMKLMNSPKLPITILKFSIRLI
jgi:hypothetical protein